MKIAIIVGGWYFPEHLYKNISQVNLPKGCSLDTFVVSHRNPSDCDIKKEINERLDYKNDFDLTLYENIADYNTLNNLGFIVHEAENLVGDFHFFNQWAEKYDYKDYDYILFMHDDNFLLPNFKEIFIDLFDSSVLGYRHINGDLNGETFNHNGKLIHTSWHESLIKEDFLYIGNSCSGGHFSPRGSFAIWSKELLDKLGGSFHVKNIPLQRSGRKDTPKDHMALKDWNMVTANFADVLERKGLKDRCYRFSCSYRISKYMIECERGFVGNLKVLPDLFKKGLKKYLNIDNI